MYHFSENAMGRLVSLSKQKKISGPVHMGEIPRWKGYRDHVVFGNDTKASVTLVSCLIAVSSYPRQSHQKLAIVRYTCMSHHFFFRVTVQCVNYI